MRYTTLLFDLDHTLFDSDGCELAAFESTMLAAGVANPMEHHATYSAINKALWAAVERHEITPEQVRVTRFERLVARVGLDANPETMAAHFSIGLGAHGELYPGASEMLNGLSQRAQLGLVTNGLSDIQRARIDRLGLERFFEAIVISAEVGTAKPGTDIFDIAFEGLGSPAKDTALMVGDSLSSDIRGGANYGIATCWYNPQRRDIPADAGVHHEVSRLDEIPSVARGSTEST